MLKSRKFLIISTQKRTDQCMKIYNYEGKKISAAKKSNLPELKSALPKGTWLLAYRLRESQSSGIVSAGLKSALDLSLITN